MPVKFDLPKDNSSIIKVIGVGGGGSNAVNHMYNQGIKGVDFMICNTDQQALDSSPVPHKIQLGASLTEGRGAGSIPEVGRNSAIENIDQIKEILEKNAKMVFVTAGMGGGTGTGAAPVIAKTAKELGILTVGIVTMPFFFEGRKRRQQADSGIEAFRESVDTLLVINNDKLREMYGNLSLAEAFAMADDVLTTAAKGIAEIITRTGYINVDFEDVRTVMTNSGVAIMGSANAQGENRAMKAVEKALASPLLNDNNIQGARYVLLNITFGNQEVLMDEISDITDYIQDEAGSTADVIWGYGEDETLGDEICVTLIATGFNSTEGEGAGVGFSKKPEKKVVNLEEEQRATTLTNPISGEAKPVVTRPTSTESAEPYLKPRVQEQPVAQEPTQQTPPQQSVQSQQPQEPQQVQPQARVEETPPEVPTPAEMQGSIEFDMRSPGTPATPVEPREEDEETPRPEPKPIMQPPLRAEQEESIEPYLKSNDESADASADQPPVSPVKPTPQVSPEEHQRKASERIMKLKDLSLKLRTPSGIADLESEPAYKRRNVRLDDVPHSSESQVSRYTLSEEENENGDKSTGLRSNNSFLHDNVD